MGCSPKNADQKMKIDRSLGAVRVATVLFPPAGLLLLWRSSRISLGRKIFGTVGIAFYALLYSALVLFLLHRFCGLQYEFRGGIVPRWTFHKTVPDYDALEASRARQRQSMIGTTNAPPARIASWPGFRGPNRDGRADEQKTLAPWPAGGLRLLWRQPIGGG